MLKRESKFHSASRRTRLRDSDYRTPTRPHRNRIFPVLFILALAAGLYIYKMPERPWIPYLERLQHVLSDRGDVGVSPGPTHPPAGSVVPEPQVQEETVSSSESATVNRPQAESLDTSGVTPVQLDISIGMGFRPVGFKIGAVSQSISISPRPDQRMHRLPRFTAPQQRYGVIRLANGREYGFALDLAAAGYRMFLDRNRNGDLRDDGEPLTNQGRGLFASKLVFPLAQVTGIPRLKGEYRLWLFTDPENWNRGKMLYYCMTQLQGALLLKGRKYRVYLADNGPVDGDYRNDGISIDLNDDGKIDRNSELFAQGQPAVINGEKFSFRITK